jgi:nitrite reductase/ring-hydroxylating ferredoxin subunit
MVSTNGRSDPAADWTDFVHTGPGTLAGRYLRSFWQPVARSQDLVAGRPQRVRIMSEDFTLYRGQSDQAHLLEARCPHRGTYLSTGWVEDDDLRCFYHGWKFDSTGQCVEQPAEDADFCRKIRIRSYPVEEYLGLVFAYLGEGDPPAMYRFPTWEAPDAGVRNAYPMVWPCNYFQFLENGVDHVHGSFVHGPRTASYGLKDVHFTLDSRGNPVSTPKGNSEASYVPWRYISSHPVVSYVGDLPGYGRALWDVQHLLIPIAVADPTLGLYSATDLSKGGTYNKTFFEGVIDIVVGRRPLTEYDDLVKAWASGGGDQIRKEYLDAIAAAR